MDGKRESKESILLAQLDDNLNLKTIKSHKVRMESKGRNCHYFF